MPLLVVSRGLSLFIINEQRNKFEILRKSSFLAAYNKQTTLPLLAVYCPFLPFIINKQRKKGPIITAYTTKGILLLCVSHIHLALPDCHAQLVRDK